MAKTTVGKHRHQDSRGRWTIDKDPDHTHDYAHQFTTAEVTALKQLLVAGGGGGTTPVPNPPPGPTPDITAPTVSGVSVSVTTTTATVVATTNEAATVIVEYSTTGVWPGTMTAATSSGTSHSRTLSGLTPGQSYVYRVRATDLATPGNLRLDGNRTFTTTAVATLPGTPTGLTATGGNTQVVLAWTAPASNGGSAITGYRIYRNGASLVTLGVVLTYPNTGLTNGLTYSYTVAAITAVGEGPQSAVASATPAAAGDINPPVISNVAITGITTTGATVSWSLNEPGNGQVEYGLTTGYGSTSTLEAGYMTGHSQTLSGLLPNKLYHLRVRSRDASNNLAQSSDRTFTTLNTTPTPSPGRPFAAPTITNIVNVAAGANVQAVVNAAPDGTEFRFEAGATFTMANGIYLQNRHHLVFTGNGATIRCTNNGSATASSMFKLDNLNSDIAIRNFTLRGSNLNTTVVYVPAQGEFQMGVIIYDGLRIEVDDCDVRQVYGDGVYVAGKNSAPQHPSDAVWVHDCTFDYIGRMGMVWNAAENCITERCTFDHVGLFVLDLESDEDYEVIDNVRFRDNTIGSYGHSPIYSNFFFACSGNQAVATVDNVYITGNVVNQGAPINNPNNSFAKGGLQSLVSRGNRLTNIVFTGNSTTKSGVGPVLVFERVDGLTVTGNTQPLVSGSLVSTSSCTGTVLSPNP